MKNVVLLDGDIALWRAVLAARDQVNWGEGDVVASVNLPKAGAHFRSTLETLRERFKTHEVFVAFGDRKANWRKELEPTYKANRRAVPRPLGFTELEEMISVKCKVFREAKLEGDDMLGLLATHPTPPSERRIICSIDKDMLTVPGSHYNFDTGVETEVSEADAQRAHFMLTLVGDRTDNFPGCPGVGPKKAAHALDLDPSWDGVLAAYARAGLDEDRAVHQARLAFVLRQGYYSRVTRVITLWEPRKKVAA